jgi:hypothetical protein
MKKISLARETVLLCAFLILMTTHPIAQSVTASPQNIMRPVAPNNVSVFLDRLSGDWGSAGSYVWDVSPSIGVIIGSYSQSGSNAADVNVTFSAAASGTYTFTLTRDSHTASVTVTIGNIAASSSSGDAIAAFSVLNGVYSKGPDPIFTPLKSTAALGISTSGYFYYLPDLYYGNDGKVTVYAAKPDGTGSVSIGSADVNGSSNNDLGFVRLAIDPIGNGWILAGDNTTLYLAKFVSNGINPATISVIDASVTVVNGNVSTFYNGDICFSGSGTMYALANSGSGGVTQIFTGTPNGSSTILTKKWDLIDQNSNSFSSPVNGVAFDALGSLYISTSSGLYFINQHTVNSASGTVQCSLVSSVQGLTDLASNFYPVQSTLPVSLTSFSGSYSNRAATLRWETENEINFDHFEIERSSNGNDYIVVGSIQAAGNNANQKQYTFSDNLSSLSQTVFTYRLKMVDIDSKIRYSNIIMIRKEVSDISGIAINPSPVRMNGMTPTLRFTAQSAGNADMKVIDLSGKIILQRRTKVYEGINSISVDRLEQLRPGTYILQLINDNETSATTFIITY